MKFQRDGKKDLTLDKEVMYAVVSGQPRFGLSSVELARVMRVSSWLTWQDSRLWIEGRIFPPIKDRYNIVVTLAAQLGFPGG